MLPGKRRQQVLLVQLRCRIDVARIKRRGLRNRLRDEVATTVFTGRLELTGLQPGNGPRSGPYHLMLLAAVPALAVYDHARRQHDSSAKSGLVHCQKTCCKPRVVVVDVGRNVAEVNAQTNLAGLMTDRIDACERASPCVEIATIGSQVFDVITQVIGFRRMRGLVEVVENHDLDATIGEPINDV